MRYLTTRRVVVAIMVMLSLSSSVHAGSQSPTDEYVRAEISYYGWDVLTRSRMSLDSIREAPQIKATIYDLSEVGRFVKWLHLEDMKNVNDVQPEDPRLVIDLIRSNSKRVTFYASRFNLVSEDGKRKRPIDETFREKFRFRP